MFAVRGPIGRGDLPGLCERACKLITGAPGAVIDCDVSGVAPDAVAVEALALLQVAATRAGCRVALHGGSPELLEVVALMGLSGVFEAWP